MTNLILPGKGNPVTYRYAAIDPSDFGQQDADVGADPADVNEAEEKPDDEDDGNGSSLMSMNSLHYSDLEENGGLDNDSGEDDEDSTDDSGGMGTEAKLSMIRWADRDGKIDRLQTGLERHEDKAPVDESKVQNLMAIHRHAQMHDPEGLHQSAYWYHGANKFAKHLSDKHGVTHEQASGVIAALSPRAHYDHENKTVADYTLSKVSPNATKRGEKLNIDEATQHKAFGFASKAYSKAVISHKNALAKHLQTPNRKATPHPGDEPEPPKHLEIGKEYSKMGDQEAANSVYNQAKHEDLRVPEDAPDARTKPKNKKDPGALRKVTMITGTRNIKKAVQIARGHSPDKILGGEKVRSFHNNIMDPDDEFGHHDLTVDTWHHDACLNKREGSFPEPAEMQSDKEATAEAHRRLAANGEIDPKMPHSGLQAQIWTHTRNLETAAAGTAQGRQGQQLVEHEGGVPKGWKAGTFKPKKFKLGTHKTAVKSKDPWIDPKGGPDENPDLHFPKEETFGYNITDDGYDEREKSNKTSMLRWAKKCPKCKGNDKDCVICDGTGDISKNDKKRYDYLQSHALNVGEDPRFEEKSEEANKAARDANNQYESQAEQAQDDFYFNYDKEHPNKLFEHKDDIPTYMSAMPHAGMLHWGNQVIKTAQQIITKDEARGDSKPVSLSEFHEYAAQGKAKLDKLKNAGSPHVLSGNSELKKSLYHATREPWGGATIHAHTGKPVENDGTDKYALTVRDEKTPRVSVHPGAPEHEFNAAYDHAVNSYSHLLDRKDHHLGVFHDSDEGRIDFDPVIVTKNLHDVHTIGAHTHAIGGAYNFRDGNGYWPPHVDESKVATLHATPEPALPTTEGEDEDVEPVIKSKVSMVRWADYQGNHRFRFIPAKNGVPVHMVRAFSPEGKMSGEIQWHPKTGEINHVRVAPDERRQGLATELYNQATNNARQNKITPPKHSENVTRAGDKFVKSFGAVQNANDEKPPSAAWQSEHSGGSQDPISAQTYPNMTDPANAFREQMGTAESDDKILSAQPLHSPGTYDDPYEDLGTSTAKRDITFGDIAANARRVLAAKVFTPAEQAELINESGKPRNFDIMDVEGTHYALLQDDEDTKW